MLLGLVSGKIGWEFHGIGALALGIASIAAALLLREKLQSIAMSACRLLIMWLFPAGFLHGETYR